MESTLREYKSPRKQSPSFLPLRYVTLPFADMIQRASVKCKQSPVYGVFWPLAYFQFVTKHELGLPFPLWKPSHKIWYKSVHNLFISERDTLRSLYIDPSVCLSSVVCRLWRWCALLRRLNFSAIFSTYDSPGSLAFWCQKSLVGDAPFPLKFLFKVTDPLSNCKISTNIGS